MVVQIFMCLNIIMMPSTDFCQFQTSDPLKTAYVQYSNTGWNDINVNGTNGNNINVNGISENNTNGSDTNENGESSENVDLQQYDFGKIQDFIEENLPESNINFSSMVKQLLSGKIKETVQTALELVKNSLLSELNSNRTIILQIILVSLVGAVFSNFSSVFQNSQISETGFFITYLLMIGLLAGAFAISISVAVSMLKQILEFMKVFIPSFFLSIALIGANFSSAAFYQTAFFFIHIINYGLLYVVIPLIEVYISILFVNYISGEDFLSKTAELVKTVVDWGLTTIFGIVMSVQVIQGMLFPVIDGVKNNTIQKLVGAIPGIGDGAAAVSKIIVGSGVLIKNGIGVAALIIITVITIIPVIKLALLCILYHIAAAIIQPMSDKRMSESVSAAAAGSKLLLKAVFLSGLLLFIMIAIVCSSTNASYLT